jgi:hypothetical protein
VTNKPSCHPRVLHLSSYSCLSVHCAVIQAKALHRAAILAFCPPSPIPRPAHHRRVDPSNLRAMPSQKQSCSCQKCRGKMVTDVTYRRHEPARQKKRELDQGLASFLAARSLASSTAAASVPMKRAREEDDQEGQVRCIFFFYTH